MRVVICTPTITEPFEAYKQALAGSAPLLKEHEVSFVLEQGNPYISGARAALLRKALDGAADAIIFIDHDLSWAPQDLLTLVETEGEVVAGTYRFKKDDEEYMGDVARVDGRIVPRLIGPDRTDGCIKAKAIPAGFMKITKEGVDKFMRAYPELCYGPAYAPSVDLFNHGAIDHVWYGEDYAFSKRWIEKCGDIWLIPTLHLDHHSADKSYPGCLHEFLMRQPGGAKARIAA